MPGINIPTPPPPLHRLQTADYKQQTHRDRKKTGVPAPAPPPPNFLTWDRAPYVYVHGAAILTTVPAPPSLCRSRRCCHCPCQGRNWCPSTCAEGGGPGDPHQPRARRVRSRTASAGDCHRPPILSLNHGARVLGEDWSLAVLTYPAWGRGFWCALRGRGDRLWTAAVLVRVPSVCPSVRPAWMMDGWMLSIVVSFCASRGIRESILCISVERLLVPCDGCPSE